MGKTAVKKKNPIWKRIRNSLFVFFILITFVWTAGYYLARPWLISKIHTSFALATGGKYTLRFDDLSLSYSEKGIYIYNIDIQPKPDSLQSLEHTSVLSLTCPEISIKNVKFWKTFWSQDFSAGELELWQPDFTIWHNTSVKPKSQNEKKNRKEGFLHLDKIRVVEAHAQLRDKEGKHSLYSAQHLNLFIDGFGISEELVPLYSHFSLEAEDNAFGLPSGNAFKIGRLFMAGNADYTGLNASEFDISEVDSAFRKALRLPDEMHVALDGISLESSSLAVLGEQLSEGNPSEIRITKLLLKHPVVSLHTKANKQSTTDNIKAISKKLALPMVDKIGILDGEFIWTQPGLQRPIMEMHNFHLMATGLRPRYGYKIPLIYSTAEIHAGKTSYTPAHSDYTFSSKHIHFRSATDSLEVLGFTVLPHKSIDSFYMDKKWRVDRFEFYCDTVQFKNLHIRQFASKDVFMPEEVVFKQPEIKAYTDKRLNHDPNFVKPFPLEKLHEIEGEYAIPTIRFENGKATYSEKVAESPGIGSLKLEKANLEVTGLKSKVSEKDTAKLLFTCSFGAGSYGEIEIAIPLFGKDEIQHGKGMIKHLPFKQLNSITENTVFMGFGGGTLDSCWFSFDALNGKSTGHSVFYYTDLRVKIYKLVEIPSYKTKILMNKTFMSMLANLLIHRNNPTEEGYSMPGKLAFQRDKLKGPLNFWIKTIMTGLMNTVIDDISELKDLQGEIKSLKSESQTGLLSKMKSNPIKKAIRKQAREAKRAVKNADETK